MARRCALRGIPEAKKFRTLGSYKHYGPGDYCKVHVTSWLDPLRHSRVKHAMLSISKDSPTVPRLRPFQIRPFSMQITALLDNRAP
jgi:hypothetical protein